MAKGKRVKVTNKGACSVSMYCQKCSVRYTLTGFSSEQIDRLYNRSETKEREKDIIPDVAPEWRELFISRTCPDCNKKNSGL